MTGNAWLSVGVALAIGLLVGSERERSGHGAVAGGVRTFALAAIAGCLAALWGAVPLAAATVGAGVIAAVGFARRAEIDSGPSTEVALVLTVLLGGTAVSSPALAAGAGVATAVILVSKERLHRFVRKSITDVEVTDALKFFVVALIILPLVPHARLGPYGAIDPRRIWTLVVAVTGLSWLGYLAVRILGPGRGMPIAGLAGGFVSGAATTGAMARHARTRGLRRAGLAGALMASVATLIQLVAITAIADVHVARLLAPAAVAGSLVLVVEAGLLSLRRKRSDSAAASLAPASAGSPPEEPDAAAAPLGRPFALVPALILAALLSVMLVAARFAQDKLGEAGTLATISVAGLADAHAGALTAATLAAAGVLSAAGAAIAALSAVGVNTIVKLVLAWAGGGPRIAVTYALLMVLPVALVAVAAVATIAYFDGAL